MAIFNEEYLDIILESSAQSALGDTFNHLSSNKKNIIYSQIKKDYNGIKNDYTPLLNKSLCKKFIIDSTLNPIYNYSGFFILPVCTFRIPKLSEDKRKEIIEDFKKVDRDLSQILHEKYKMPIVHVDCYLYRPQSVREFSIDIEHGYEASIMICLKISISKYKTSIKELEKDDSNKKSTIDISKIMKFDGDDYVSVTARFLGHHVYIEVDGNKEEVAETLNKNIDLLNKIFNSKYKDTYYKDIADEANSSDKTVSWNASNIKSKTNEDIYYDIESPDKFYIKIIACCYCKNAFGAEFLLKMENGKDSFVFEYTDNL